MWPPGERARHGAVVRRAGLAGGRQGAGGRRRCWDIGVSQTLQGLPPLHQPDFPEGSPSLPWLRSRRFSAGWLLRSISVFSPVRGRMRAESLLRGRGERAFPGAAVAEASTVPSVPGHDPPSGYLACPAAVCLCPLALLFLGPQKLGWGTLGFSWPGGLRAIGVWDWPATVLMVPQTLLACCLPMGWASSPPLPWACCPRASLRSGHFSLPASSVLGHFRQALDLSEAPVHPLLTLPPWHLQ